MFHIIYLGIAAVEGGLGWAHLYIYIYIRLVDRSRVYIWCM